MKININYQLENIQLKEDSDKYQRYQIGLTNQNFLDEYISRQSELYRLRRKTNPLMGGNVSITNTKIKTKMKHGNNMISGLINFIDKKFSNKLINLISKKNKFDRSMNI